MKNFLFLVLLFLGLSAVSQNYTQFAPSVYNQGGVSMIRQLPNGNLIGVTEETYVKLYTAQGISIDSFDFATGSSTYQNEIFVEDDGVVIVNTTSDTGAYTHGFHFPNPASFSLDIWMMKIDFNMDTLWTKSIGSHRNDVMNKMIKSKDGGYIMIATAGDGGGDVDTNIIDSTNVLRNIYWLCKLDSNANIEWQYAPDETSFGSIRQGVAEDTAGNIYLYLESTNPVFFIIDKDGNHIKRVDSTNFVTKMDIIERVILTEDNRLLVCGEGRYTDGFTYPVIEVYDTSGQFVEEHWLIEEIGRNSAYIDFQQDGDYLYFLIRAEDDPLLSNFDNDIVWVKYDINNLSSPVYIDRIYGDNDDDPLGFTLMNNGGMAISAYSNTKALHYWNNDFELPLGHVIIFDSCSLSANFSSALDINKIAITDLSTNSVFVEYFFDSLGSTTSSNPVYTFEDTGSFQICQVAESDNLCEQTYCETVFIDSIPNTGIYNPLRNQPVVTIENGIVYSRDSRITSMIVYDVLGHKVAQTNSTILSTKHLASGVYVLEILIDGKMRLNKFMVD